jgi:hypothetical protein
VLEAAAELALRVATVEPLARMVWAELSARVALAELAAWAERQAPLGLVTSMLLKADHV